MLAARRDKRNGYVLRWEIAFFYHWLPLVWTSTKYICILILLRGLKSDGITALKLAFRLYIVSGLLSFLKPLLSIDRVLVCHIRYSNNRLISCCRNKFFTANTRCDYFFDLWLAVRWVLACLWNLDFLFWRPRLIVSLAFRRVYLFVVVQNSTYATCANFNWATSRVLPDWWLSIWQAAVATRSFF